MKVKQRMTPNPITIGPKTSHRDAVELMRENKIRRLPVVDRKGKLIGIVTETDLLSTSPSSATTLSIFEIYTLLDKLMIDQIMTKPVYAVEEDCSLEATARFMIDKRISGFPVVRGEELVGVITETDIFKAFVEVLGGGEPGLRIDMQVPDQVGMLAAITQVFANAGGNIASLTTFRGEDTQHKLVSIKERGADASKLKVDLEALENVENVEIQPGGESSLIAFGD